MKKLIIAMTAAWAGAYIAHAADGTISCTSFEGLTAGDPLNITFTDNGEAMGDKYWSVEGYVSGEGTLPEVGVISNHVEGVTLPTRHAEFVGSDNNNYLAVDTEKKLFRNINADGSASGITSTGLFVDTLVQFTATETAPTPDAADKLIVWLQAIDADEATGVEGSTNLVVTAGQLDDEASPTKNDYVISNVSIEPNSWHRLTIKSMLADFTTADGSVQVPKFEVLIDGTTLSTAANDTLFASLVKYNGTGAKTLTSLAVEGTGAIDDIVFTTVDPFPAVVENYFRVGTTEYATFTEALTAALADGADGKITLIKDAALTYNADDDFGVEIAADQAVIIDLAGKKLSTTGRNVIVNKGNLKVINSTDTVGSIESSWSDEEDPEALPRAIRNYGTLEIAGGKFKYLVVNEEDEETGDPLGQMTVTGPDTSKTYELVEGTGADAGYLVIGEEGGSDPSTTFTVRVNYDGTAVEVAGIPTGKVEAGNVELTVTAKAGYKNVVVKVGDTAIVGEDNVYTIAVSADTTVTITAEPLATPTITIVNETGAAVSGVTAGTATEGSTFSVSATPAAGYKNVQVSVEGATAEDGVYTVGTEDITVTITATEITYATVTITAVDNCTVTVKNGDATVSSGDKFDVDDKVTLTVTRVAAEGFELDNCAAEETIEVTESLTITAAVKSTTPATELPTYIEGKSAATVAKYNAWAEKYGADKDSAYEEAYLLNCDPADVATAKAAFKFTAIVPGEIPTISGIFNGELVILGGTSLADIASWDEATETDNFFKATLVVEKPQASNEQ